MFLCVFKILSLAPEVRLSSIQDQYFKEETSVERWEKLLKKEGIIQVSLKGLQKEIIEEVEKFYLDQQLDQEVSPVNYQSFISIFADFVNKNKSIEKISELKLWLFQMVENRKVLSIEENFRLSLICDEDQKKAVNSKTVNWNDPVDCRLVSWEKVPLTEEGKKILNRGYCHVAILNIILFYYMKDQTQSSQIKEVWKHMSQLDRSDGKYLISLLYGIKTSLGEKREYILGLKWKLEELLFEKGLKDGVIDMDFLNSFLGGMVSRVMKFSIQEMQFFLRKKIKTMLQLNLQWEIIGLERNRHRTPLSLWMFIEKDGKGLQEIYSHPLMIEALQKGFFWKEDIEFFVKDNRIEELIQVSHNIVKDRYELRGIIIREILWSRKKLREDLKDSFKEVLLNFFEEVPEDIGGGIIDRIAGQFDLEFLIKVQEKLLSKGKVNGSSLLVCHLLDCVTKEKNSVLEEVIIKTFQMKEFKLFILKEIFKDKFLPLLEKILEGIEDAGSRGMYLLALFRYNNFLEKNRKIIKLILKKKVTYSSYLISVLIDKKEFDLLKELLVSSRHIPINNNQEGSWIIYSYVRLYLENPSVGINLNDLKELIVEYQLWSLEALFLCIEQGAEELAILLFEQYQKCPKKTRMEVLNEKIKNHLVLAIEKGVILRNIEENYQEPSYLNLKSSLKMQNLSVYGLYEKEELKIWINQQKVDQLVSYIGKAEFFKKTSENLEVNVGLVQSLIEYGGKEVIQCLKQRIKEEENCAGEDGLDESLEVVMDLLDENDEDTLILDIESLLRERVSLGRFKKRVALHETLLKQISPYSLYTQIFEKKFISKKDWLERARLFKPYLEESIKVFLKKSPKEGLSLAKKMVRNFKNLSSVEKNKASNILFPLLIFINDNGEGEELEELFYVCGEVHFFKNYDRDNAIHFDFLYRFARMMMDLSCKVQDQFIGSYPVLFNGKRKVADNMAHVYCLVLAIKRIMNFEISFDFKQKIINKIIEEFKIDEKEELKMDPYCVICESGEFLEINGEIRFKREMFYIYEEVTIYKFLMELQSKNNLSEEIWNKLMKARERDVTKERIAEWLSSWIKKEGLQDDVSETLEWLQKIKLSNLFESSLKGKEVYQKFFQEKDYSKENEEKFEEKVWSFLREMIDSKESSENYFKRVFQTNSLNQFNKEGLLVSA